MWKYSYILWILGIILLFVWVWTFAIKPLAENSKLEYGRLLLQDKNGIIWTQKWEKDGYMKPFTWSLESEVVKSILKVEDSRYFSHFGIDIIGKLAWIRDNIRAGGIVRWSSTLTEQYIKNVYYTSKSRTWTQKIRESIWALYMNTLFTKEELLRMYLDNVYFGNRIYGLQTAIDFYFPWKSETNLSKDEILDIITRIHTPSITKENQEKAKLYRTNIARKLEWKAWEDMFLSEIKQLYYKNLYPLVTKRIEREIENYCRGKKWSLEKWVETIPKDICTEKNKILTVSLDSSLMKYASDILSKNIALLKKENVDGGAVYIYNPTKRKVLASIGNSETPDGLTSEVDMTERSRSVGSLLKPFVYYLALKEWWEIDDFILDSDKIYPSEYDGKWFVPSNYTAKSYWPVRLREALGNSLNASSVRVAEYIGIDKIYDFLRGIWITLQHDAGYYGYGIALWTLETSLENVVESYSFFTWKNEKDIFLINSILSDPKNRAMTFGISSILNTSIPFPVKTGTSTDFRDNWVVSWHNDAIIGVWVWNPNGSSMKDVSGVSGAWPIWHSIAEYMVSRWMIQNTKNIIPQWVYETYICIDIRCLQKQKTWKKSKKEQKSRPKDTLYFHQDFIGIIDEDEQRTWNIQTE